MFGPCSSRHNDLWTLEHSNFIPDLIQLHHTNGANPNTRYCAYGDSIYFNQECLRAKNRNWGLSDNESRMNRGLNSVRESIEWSYGQICTTLFPYVAHKNFMKVKNMPVGDIIFTCFLLRNLHVCLNGSTGSITLPPTLQEYMNE